MKLPFPIYPSSFHCFRTKLQPSKLRPHSRHMPITAQHRHKDKIVVVVGATGTGKSSLSIELATRFSGEVVNSDKMQVYKGLDITTNKIPMHERGGVAHHLLGVFDPVLGEFGPSLFRSAAADRISDITLRGNLPLIAGGSNSFIHALLVDQHDPESDPFEGSGQVSTQLRYSCCFLWVDVSFPVLDEYLCKRVDDMLDLGMFEELAEFFRTNQDDEAIRPGLTKAIGVPEFRRFFKEHRTGIEVCERNRMRQGAYEEAVRAIKENTCQLARRQLGKIDRLREGGWDLRRLDATAAFQEALVGGKKRAEIWERQVVEPSVKIVKWFLEE